MSRKTDIFESVLTSSYNHTSFVDFVREFLNDMDMVAPTQYKKIYNNFSYYVDGYYHIGNYQGDNGEKIAIFSVALRKGDSVERSRTMQRNFIKPLIEAGNCAGALVAFYTPEEPDKWRLSFIRLDYEFSKGKITEKLTPAKRYSYLVGKGEPCNTAKQRLFPIFQDDNNNPGIDDLEEAFSVEKVTNEFFQLYCEKYHELREYLESNDDFMQEAQIRNFTSEQFAKKLLGQIVFLYFIQKKGWLGVDAIPVTMTEKEYKNAFFARGQRSRDIVGSVYAEQADGSYKVVFDKLQALSDEDEDFLATIVKGKPWGTGPRDFMRRMFDGCVSAGKNYFDDYLEPLFYTGLNLNRGENGYYPPLHRRIPFLNGGLFEQLDNYEWENNDFNIPNSIFSNADEKGKRDADGILDIFDRYNFTMNEDEPMEREVAIDPEMLGKVFENLLDVKDRKSKGAFYTPREIVHYMCQETLINHLVTKTGISEDAIRDFIIYGEYLRDEDTVKTLKVTDESGKSHYEFDKNKDLLISEEILSYKKGINRLKEIDDLLANVKVADLAVGSGAFPLGMLNEIVRARQVLTEYLAIEMNAFQKKTFYAYERKSYDLKVNTIKNCIFACDIEPSAADIAKLRLWLSIVIDDEITDDAGNGDFDAHTKPRQLPNLDCNIICGNSLVDEFMGNELITTSSLLGNDNGIQQTIFQSGVDVLLGKLIELQDKLFFTKEHSDKEDIKASIQKIYDEIILEQIGTNPLLTEAYYNSLSESSKPFILWQLYFPKVFQSNGGFDIIIGNPPYVQISKEEWASEEYKSYLRNRYGTSGGRLNLYIFMIHKGLELLSDKGVISYIIPNTILTQDYYKDTRKLILEKHSMRSIIDFVGMQFDNAVVENITFVATKNKLDNYSVKVLRGIDKHFEFYKDIPVERFMKQNNYSFNIYSNEFIDGLFEDANALSELCNINQAIALKGDKSLSVKDTFEDGYYKLLDGRNINKYSINWTGAYLDYDLERIHSCKRKDIFEADEKLLFRRVSSSLIATYDDEQYYALNTLVVVTPKTDSVNLKYVLALLNSTLFNYIYSKKFKSTKKVFSEIQARSVGELPVRRNHDIEELIVNLVSEVISIKKEDINADTSVYEKKINSYIYEIYELSESDIEMIEGEG